MTESRVVLQDEADRGARRIEWQAVWRLLGVIGVVFLIVGGIDEGLVWVPSGFGHTEWEFGSVSAGLNGLPLPLLGLGLMLAQALVQGRRVYARAVVVVLVVLVLAVVVVGVVYATDVPLALRAVGDNDVARLGMRKSVLKAAFQLIAYPIGLGWLSWRSWRMTRREA